MIDDKHHVSESQGNYGSNKRPTFHSEHKKFLKVLRRQKSESVSNFLLIILKTKSKNESTFVESSF